MLAHCLLHVVEEIKTKEKCTWFFNLLLLQMCLCHFELLFAFQRPDVSDLGGFICGMWQKCHVKFMMFY